MTLPSLRAFTRRLLNEQVPSDSYWDDATLDDYLNRANEFFHLLTEVSQGQTQYNSAAGVQEVTLSSAVIKPKRVFYLNPTTSKFKLLDFRTVTELDLENSAWFTLTAENGSTPTKFAFRGSTLYLVPAPFETATNAVRVWGVHGPAQEMSDPTHTPGTFPAVFHHAIAYWAAVMALEQDRLSPGATTGIARLEKRFHALVLMASDAELQKGPAKTVRDIRDFYQAEYRS